jgi:23S rRNA (adenine-N6)-dimethyltransferase
VAGQHGRPRPRSERDQRRRSASQNFLVDHRAARRFVDRLDIVHDELVLDVGAGTGALTFPCVDAGARVLAVEHDPVWAGQLRDRVAARHLDDRITVIHADFRVWPLPRDRFRVIANPPFVLSTELLRRLLDNPVAGPDRCDVILQTDVVRKRAMSPPDDLRTAAWSPWWTFEAGPGPHRSAFRPVPAVDAAVLTVRRRVPATLPTWMAPGFLDVLRPAWDRHHR